MNFPDQGRPISQIRKELEVFQIESLVDEASALKNLNPRSHLTGLTNLQKLIDYIMPRFIEANGLSAKGVHRMEQEVVSMLGSLWKLDNPYGLMTAGGTESNILAMHVAVNRSKGKRGNVILPKSAHPSFFKACHFLGLRPVIVPLKDDFTADPELTRKAVDSDTIAIVGSCGCFPWGAIDPIEELGEIAETNSLYFHVDGSWGAPMVPWLECAGYDIPKFDFRVKGVSSLCGDPHKQGFSILPAGAIVFRDEELLNFAGFRSTDAQGYGGYFTKGLLGSRPGFSVAVTWAFFNYLGKSGYIDLSKKCMDLTLHFLDEAEKIPGLSRVLTPKVNLANVMSSTANMSLVKQEMRQRGWNFFEARGQPFSRTNTIVVSAAPYHEKVLPHFLEELRSVVQNASTLG